MARVLYDASNNTWISDDAGRRPSSGTALSAASPAERAPDTRKPRVYGATAELWQLPTSERDTEHRVLRFPLSASSPRPHPLTQKAVGTLAYEALEFLTTVAGLLIFASIALFCLALA